MPQAIRVTDGGRPERLPKKQKPRHSGRGHILNRAIRSSGDFSPPLASPQAEQATTREDQTGKINLTPLARLGCLRAGLPAEPAGRVAERAQAV
jgi:hypothetical protein